MGNIKTMYSLKNIFTDFLEDAEKNGFIIPAYQRGYKWGSTGGNSQVEVLLRDLFNAFSTGRNRYYLQFITLKEKENELEVIDGQQRLTTITIIFSVLNKIETFEDGNFVLDKLNYEVRQNFIQKFIYTNIDLLSKAKDWSDFLESNASDHADINNQDVFYIFHAFKKINQFIDEIPPDQKMKFIEYLYDRVFLIINYLDKDLNSEKIFINVNKGVKLRDDDLVKGLLITKIPVDQQQKHFRLTENEINETRTNIGRQWDEISEWSFRDDIRGFFRVSNHDKGIGWIIKLSFPEADAFDDTYPLFSYIDEIYRTSKLSAEKIFATIRETVLTLNDWFNDPEIYNLLGYILHSKNQSNIFTIWKELYEIKTKPELFIALKSLCKQFLPVNKIDGKLDDLNYEDHRSELFNLFLILDVAKSLPIGKEYISKYDFSQISSDSWSIEHIFPQNLKELKGIKSLAKDDLNIVKELLDDGLEENNLIPEEQQAAVEQLASKIKSSLAECPIDQNEQITLEYLFKNRAVSLHRLGNLALLKQGMNSSLSNHFFDAKRKILVKKISDGEFVPSHTYDVFSKLIIDSNTSLHIWNKSDIENHQAYIESRIFKIFTYLKN